MFLSQDCLDCLIWYLCWLVVWNMNFIFPYIGNCIIPTGEVIFSRGAWWPDCSRCKSKRSYSSMESQFACKPKESRACSLVRKRCWTVMACIGQLDPYNPPNLWLSDMARKVWWTNGYPSASGSYASFEKWMDPRIWSAQAFKCVHLPVCSASCRRSPWSVAEGWGASCRLPA